MLKKLLSFLYLIFLCHTSLGQTNQFEIDGQILNPDSQIIINAHILNLNSNLGTISNQEGKFTLQVKLGDWIQITNIQFYSKKIRITNGHLKEKNILIYLIPHTNLLDEVDLKKRMTGFLGFDRIKEPKDTIGDLMKSMKNKIISIPFDKIMGMEIGNDERHLLKPTVTPGLLHGFKGVGASATIPYADLIKKRADKKFINFKEQFPYNLMKLFGEHFFFVQLKIPEENYYHFLEYCTPLGIEELYKTQKDLDILKILLKESKSYLLLLENNK